MVPGTLDMLILQLTGLVGPAHGQTISHAIERGSEEVLQVEHGSLYPALRRLENRGWIASFWELPRITGKPSTITSRPRAKSNWWRNRPVGNS